MNPNKAGHKLQLETKASLGWVCNRKVASEVFWLLNRDEMKGERKQDTSVKECPCRPGDIFKEAIPRVNSSTVAQSEEVMACEQPGLSNIASSSR